MRPDGEVRWLDDRLASLGFWDESTSTQDAWTQVAATVKAPEGAHFAQVMCVAKYQAAGDGPFDAWFDDVTVEELRTSGTTLLFQGVPMEPVAVTNPPPAATCRAALDRAGLA